MKGLGVHRKFATLAWHVRDAEGFADREVIRDHQPLLGAPRSVARAGSASRPAVTALNHSSLGVRIS